MLKIKLLLFKIRHFIIIYKSRALKKKINFKYRINKEDFENYIATKKFSQKWFLKVSMVSGRKVNSVQKPCIKRSAVHLLKFEILQS